jgi:uncharacterized tellurite resistance protein B-like protein
MLKTLKDLFDSLAAPAPTAPGASAEHTLQLATAVLLVEVMRADPDLAAVEREAILAALRDKFALADDEGERLVELAHQTSREASDLFRFTSRINESFDDAQKARMIEHMWRVAYADSVLDAHENHLMRRIADLLHVPHRAFIVAKLRAEESGQ